MSSGSPQSGILEVEIIKLIKELSSLKTTVDISFTTFNDMLSKLSEELDHANKQTDANTKELDSLRRNINNIVKNCNTLKNDVSKRVDKIENSMVRFSKKIDWKKVSKGFVIWSTIVGTIIAIILNLGRLKEMFSGWFN